MVLNKLFKHTPAAGGLRLQYAGPGGRHPARALAEGDAASTTSSTRKRSSPAAPRYELAKAEERAHILEGYIIALDNIDEVIHDHPLLRDGQGSRRGACTERFGLSEKQTNAILEMRLRRLTGLERTKIEEELAELREKIAYYKRILADENSW